jgi:hypothetical protein
VYKFVSIQGGCGENAYNLGKCEETANQMEANGFRLVHIYETSTVACAAKKSTLVMVFESDLKS